MGVLWLIGMMGSGKTAVGEAVARLSRLPFVDTDRQIEKQCGLPISSIWDSAGEDAFRALEKDQIARIVLAARDCVVATGGGAILDADNRRLMGESGAVIWLTASIDALSGRMIADRTRPLLEGQDMKERLRELLDERAGWYAATADHELDTSGKGVEEIAREVVSLWHVS
jgi:shikimate kinase